jgi:hypothetical protein
VRVTVHGGNSIDMAMSGIVALSNTTSVQSFRRAQSTMLSLTPLKLVPALHKNAPRNRGRRNLKL